MKTRKLLLNRETLRVLQDSDLRRVAGGIGGFPFHPDFQVERITTAGCGPTDSCILPFTRELAPSELAPWGGGFGPTG